LALPAVVIAVLIFVIIFQESLLKVLKSLNKSNKKIESKYNIMNKVKILVVFSQVLKPPLSFVLMFAFQLNIAIFYVFTIV